MSIHGYRCVNWTETSYKDSRFPDGIAEDAGSKCRSPDADPALWCYVKKKTWDYCGSPPCFGL